MTKIDEQRLIAELIKWAERRYHEKTGKQLRLVQEQDIDSVAAVVQDVMRVVADALGMNEADYYAGSNPQYVDLRCLATVAIMKEYPSVRVRHIIMAMNLKCHSAVIDYQRRAKERLSSGHAEFVRKYTLVMEAVAAKKQTWCRKERADKVESLLQLIATTLGMPMDAYRQLRGEESGDLRSIASLYVSELYPKVTLDQLQEWYGLKCHSGVVYAKKRGYNRLYVKDAVFVEKYDKVKKAIEA